MNTRRKGLEGIREVRHKLEGMKNGIFTVRTIRRFEFHKNMKLKMGYMKLKL
jgi:hypothetical protein